MSSGKDRNTKILEDDNTDSGFLSGPLSEQLLSSEEIDVEDDSDSKKVVSESEDPYQCLDSGLDLCISEDLAKVTLSDAPTAQLLPTITVEDSRSQEYPPLDVLFQQDDDGDTQLHIAAVHGCQKSVGTLIRVCPDKEWLNVPNDFGYTALHLAVLNGHSVVARMLVRAGAALGARDLAGQTPLHVATARKRLECLQALLAPVPEHPPRKIASVLNQKDYEGQTCIHIAASMGYLDALQTLNFYGADINAREGLAGWTALHIAARRGDVVTARFLLERGAGGAGGAGGAPRDYAGRSARALARRSPAAAAFPPADSDDDSEDDDEVDSESESLFEKIRESMNPINVA